MKRVLYLIFVLLAGVLAPVASAQISAAYLRYSTDQNGGGCQASTSRSGVSIGG